MMVHTFEGDVIDFDIKEGDLVIHPDLDKPYIVGTITKRKVDLSIYLIDYGYFIYDLRRLKKAKL